MGKRLVIPVFMFELMGSCMGFVSISHAQQAPFSYTDATSNGAPPPIRAPKPASMLQEPESSPTQQEAPTNKTQGGSNPYMPSSPLITSANREGSKETMDYVIEREQEKNPDINKKFENRATGRKWQEAGKTIQSGTSMAAKPLTGVTNFAGTVVAAALPPGEIKLGITLGLAAANVLIQAFKGLGTTTGGIVSAYGRFKEKSQEIATANEQIIEAANQSDIKIQKLSKQLESLLNPLTVRKIFGSRNAVGEQLPVSKRLLGLFAPSMYANTFKEFTDKTYITDNKSKKWEIIQSISKELNKEQKYYDELIIILRIKMLESSIVELNKLINKEEKEETIKRLNNDSVFFLNRLQEIQAELKNTKNNLFNRRKYNNLVTQQNEMGKKIDQTRKELDYYQANHGSKEVLEKYRKELIDVANSLSNQTNIKNKPDYLKKEETAQAAQDVKTMQTKITSIEQTLSTVVQRLNRLEAQRPVVQARSVPRAIN